MNKISASIVATEFPTSRSLSSPGLLRIALVGMLLCSAGTVLAQTSPAAPPPRPRVTAPAPVPVAPAPAATAPTVPVAPPAAVAQVAKSADSEVVARVGGRDISVAEVREFLTSLDGREQAALVRDPALLSQTLRLMLASQLALKEALAKKWQDQPSVAAQLQRIRDNAITEIYLQTVSVPPQSFPDDAEVQKAYDTNKSAFLVPRQFRIAQVFVALGSGADKEAEDKARKKLAEVQLKLKQPKADFATLAKEYSDQQDSAERGGEIGWVAETQVRPEIKEQVMGLAKNAIAEPVKLDDGWHILKLIDTKPAETRPLAEVRDLLVQRLRAQRAEVNRRGYLGKLLEQSPPAVNEIALTKVFGEAKENPPSR